MIHGRQRRGTSVPERGRFGVLHRLVGALKLQTYINAGECCQMCSPRSKAKFQFEVSAAVCPMGHSHDIPHRLRGTLQLGGVSITYPLLGCLLPKDPADRVQGYEVWYLLRLP